MTPSEAQDNFGKLLLSFYPYIASRGQTRAIRLARQVICPLSHICQYLNVNLSTSVVLPHTHSAVCLHFLGLLCALLVKSSCAPRSVIPRGHTSDTYIVMLQQKQFHG